MTNLDRPEGHPEIVELARELASEVLAPAARTAEQQRAIPEEVWTTLFGTGLAVPVPEELGGDGVLGTLAETAAVEQLAHGDPAITVGAFWSGAAALLLSRHGSPGQSDIVRGIDASWRGSVALYEGYGRAPAEYTTTVESAGGTVRVRGRKVAVPFATQAADVIVIGVDPAGGGLRAAVVPATAPGLLVTPDAPGLALDAVPTATVDLDVELDAAAVLGAGSADPVALAGSVERIRLIVASALVGTAARATEYAAVYARDRIAFGKPIAAFQGVSFLLAEAKMRTDAARLEIADVAARLDAGDVERGSALVTGALAYAASVATQATRDAVQVLGGHGFITDHPVELWYRSAGALSVLDLDPLSSMFEPAL